MKGLESRLQTMFTAPGLRGWYVDQGVVSDPRLTPDLGLRIEANAWVHQVAFVANCCPQILSLELGNVNQSTH